MKNRELIQTVQAAGINRKGFLKTAGLGSLAAMAGLGPLATAARADDEDEDEGNRVYTFVAFSQAGTVGGVVHRIAMQGAGRFSPEESEVAGGGSFVHFDNAPPVPKPILDSGRWQPTKFLSYQRLSPPGIYGHIEAGILEMQVSLRLDNGSVVSGAILRLICNIGAAGFSTGEPEGYKLTIPGAAFGTFAPIIQALAAGGTIP